MFVIIVAAAAILVFAVLLQIIGSALAAGTHKLAVVFELLCPQRRDLVLPLVPYAAELGHEILEEEGQ